MIYCLAPTPFHPLCYSAVPMCRINQPKALVPTAASKQRGGLQTPQGISEAGALIYCCWRLWWFGGRLSVFPKHRDRGKDCVTGGIEAHSKVMTCLGVWKRGGESCTAGLVPLTDSHKAF